MRFAPYYTCNENADIEVYNARRKRFDFNPKAAICNQVR